MENEGHHMSFGHAKIFSHEELKEATNNFDSELGHAEIFSHEELKEATNNFDSEFGHAEIFSHEELKEAINNFDSELGHAKIFSHEELKEATNNFDSELGRGGFGKVYLGTLHGKKVAVKKLNEDNPRLVEQFVNEVSILSRIRHPNLVTLHGSTDSSSHELLLVYDFVPNGTVAEHLHVERSTLTWDLRIQIAVETAEAVAYIHALDSPVIHRDIKTFNILLDNDFHAKVADFGICRLFPSDAIHVSTLPQGTCGYRDPEYDRTMKLTEKSDVYSFGVVLLELMTGMQAVDVHRGRENIYLVDMITGNWLEKLVDSKLNYHSDTDSRRMINLVAVLARKCLHTEGRMRPTMVETLEILREIQNKRYAIDDRYVYGAQGYVFSPTMVSHFTEAFHESRHTGKKEYIGNIEGLPVSVKVQQVKKLSEREEMSNNVKVLSKIRHQNLATLYGSTDSGNNLMVLVYEHVPNGRVRDHLHSPHSELLLKIEEHRRLDWTSRIQIAIGTAEALSFLHSLEPPVIHHEISTYNILLDYNYHVRLSGLNLDWKSTFKFFSTTGYGDPSWREVFWTTTKYDVYSFGVVLLELISGNEASTEGELGIRGNFLGKWGAKMIKKNGLDVLADKRIDYHSNSDTKKMVTSVAELACRCVQRDRDMRPTMAEVLWTLKQIKDGTEHPFPTVS